MRVLIQAYEPDRNIGYISGRFKWQGIELILERGNPAQRMWRGVITLHIPTPPPLRLEDREGGWLVVKKYRPLRPAVYGRAFLKKRVKNARKSKIGKKLKNRGS